MPQTLTAVLLEHHAVLRLYARDTGSERGIKAFATVLGGHLIGMEQAFVPALLTIPAASRLVDETTQSYKAIAQLLVQPIDPREDREKRVAWVALLLLETEKALRREQLLLLPAAVIGLSTVLAASVAARLEALFLEFVGGTELSPHGGEAEAEPGAQQSAAQDERPQQSESG